MTQWKNQDSGSLDPGSPAAVIAWRRVRRNGLPWRVNSAVVGLESLLHRLDDPDALLDASARRLGTNPKALSEVIRVPLPERTHGALIVKRYRPRTRWHPVKDWFRGSAAVRAFHRGLLLNRRGIQTATVLAASEQAPGRWSLSYLITEEVPEAVMLRDWIRDEPNPTRRRKMAIELGRLMARLHDAGFEHTDPSLTNFLVAGPDSPHPQVVLIDLDGLRGRRLTVRRAADGLRHLGERAHVAPRERLWFLVSYSRARRVRLDSHDLAAQVGTVLPRASSLPPPRNAPGSPATVPVIQRPPSSPGMTGCLTNLRIGALWWTTRAEVRNEADWMRALSDPDACLAAAVHRFKDSSNVTIVRLPAASQTGPNLVLRRLNYGRLRHRLRDTFRRSRAQRALRMALRMEAAGLSVARGLAAADVRRWRWPLRAYFVTEEIRAARTLAEIANGPAQPPRECVERLAQLLAQLHERGFSHRDLKATNVLFDPEGQPFLIDLDGVKQFRHLPRKRAAKDLARLVAGLRSSPWLQPRLIIRFLKVYCRAQTESDWRAWFSMVEAALQRYQE